MQLRRLLGDVLGAVARVGVAAEPLRRAAAALLLDGLEHAREFARVVAGARHDLRAHQVRLLLVLPAVFHQPSAQPELRALRDDLTEAPADDGPGDGAGECANLKPLCLGGVGGAVAEQHVREFVRHHARDLAFTGGRLDHPAIDEHGAARQSKGVDVLEVNRRE